MKAQTVSIIHTHTDGKKYLINLIDTPGHVDFSYEVSRSLGACEGGLLLVDSTRECKSPLYLGSSRGLIGQRAYKRRRYRSFTMPWKQSWSSWP